MSIFTLFSAFSASIAWFQMITQDNGDANNMPVKDLEDSVRLIEFHNYVETVTVNGIEYYTFDKTPSCEVVLTDGVAEQSATLEMDRYELDDPHHPVLILMELAGGTTTIKATLDENECYYVADGEHTIDENGGNPLSSIVEFFAFTYSKTSSDATSLASRKLTVDATEYYSLKTNEFVRSGSNANNSAFVQLDEYGDFDSLDTDVTIYSGNVNEYEYLGIVVDYYAESLAYIYSYFLGDPVLNDDLFFSCDWEMIL